MGDGFLILEFIILHYQPVKPTPMNPSFHFSSYGWLTRGMTIYSHLMLRFTSYILYKSPLRINPIILSLSVSFPLQEDRGLGKTYRIFNFIKKKKMNLKIHRRRTSMQTVKFCLNQWIPNGVKRLIRAAEEDGRWGGMIERQRFRNSF